MTEAARNVWQRIRPKTLIEWLIVIAIIAVLVALLLPAARWASSGDITVPVHVVVFDPISGKPIPQAQVGIFRYRTIFSPQDIEPLNVDLTQIAKVPTNAEGSVIIDQKFYTGASHRRPVTHAHLAGVWIIVEAKGYSRVLVPCRYEELPTADLRKRGELFVPVALLPAK